MLHTPRADPDVVVGPSGSYLGCLTANRWFGQAAKAIDSTVDQLTAGSFPAFDAPTGTKH